MVNSSLENLEMSGPLTPVRKISGNWPKVMEIQWKCQGKLFNISNLCLGLCQCLVNCGWPCVP